MGRVKHVKVHCKLRIGSRLREIGRERDHKAGIAVGLIGVEDFPREPEIINGLLIMPAGWQAFEHLVRLVAKGKQRGNMDIIVDITRTITDPAPAHYEDMRRIKGSNESVERFREIYLNTLPRHAIIHRA